MPFARTQTTVATGYAWAVTAHRAGSRATAGANPIGRCPRLAIGGVTAILPRKRMTKSNFSSSLSTR